VGILELLFSTSPTYEKILYIDIDIHHGDGVEEAFANSERVFTVSLHHLSKGFYPGTGNFDPNVIKRNNEKGNISDPKSKSNHSNRGLNLSSSLNIPFHEGLKDADFIYVFEAILPSIFKRIQPSIVIVQCGVDGLACDPFTKWSLTNRAFVRCISKIFENCNQPNVVNTESQIDNTKQIIPVILLGGGGYNNTAVSRTWTLMTAVAVGVKIPLTIPDHVDIMHYRPDFALLTKELSIIANLNTSAYLTSVISYARLFLSTLITDDLALANKDKVPFADLYDGDDESPDEIRDDYRIHHLSEM
jgi:acetoin utilization deacetylase AcuC-like enzyme